MRDASLGRSHWEGVRYGYIMTSSPQYAILHGVQGAGEESRLVCYGDREAGVQGSSGVGEETHV